MWGSIRSSNSIGVNADKRTAVLIAERPGCSSEGMRSLGRHARDPHTRSRHSRIELNSVLCFAPLLPPISICENGAGLSKGKKMSTSWTPTTAEERLDRLESLEQIRQLPHRYALAVDTRALDSLVQLFVDDVQVSRDLRGREPLKTWFAEALSRFGDTIHFVGNHVIGLNSPTQASGVVTCRDELEAGAEWRVGFIQYWDKYLRRNGRWYFERRKLH